jgi:hypothetical protein
MRYLRLAATIALALTTILAATFLLPLPVEAAPNCYTQYVPTSDMAGAYYAPDLSAYIEVNACGGVEIVWENSRGVHNAQYSSTSRIRGGGFFARAYSAYDGTYPNGAGMIGIKPAERGYIQMATFDQFANLTGEYRLHKIR